MGFLTDILEHLGIHKNPLFLFVLVGSKLIHEIAKDLIISPETWVRHSGVFMNYCPVLLILIAVVFYIWAACKLPGSVQELEFQKSSERALKQHRERRSRRIR